MQVRTKNKITRILLMICCFACAAASFAQQRVALVIGNSDYQKQSLKNPTNDARDISKVLRSLGFKVNLKLNANQEDMESAIQSFGKKLQSSAVGLFYFSGHGVQHEGSNYLIPIGAMSSVSTSENLRYKTVDAGYVLGVMKQAGNGLNIVILDACRNNPFESFSRSMERGLTRISGAEGTIIAYSTSPGNVALDGDGRNSPYTEQLVKLMQHPNVPVELMFKQVRKRVKSQTGGKQAPWYEASIDGDFYFSTKQPAETFNIKKMPLRVSQQKKQWTQNVAVAIMNLDKLSFRHNTRPHLVHSFSKSTCELTQKYPGGETSYFEIYQLKEINVTLDKDNQFTVLKLSCKKRRAKGCMEFKSAKDGHISYDNSRSHLVTTNKDLAINTVISINNLKKSCEN